MHKIWYYVYKHIQVRAQRKFNKIVVRSTMFYGSVLEAFNTLNKVKYKINTLKEDWKPGRHCINQGIQKGKAKTTFPKKSSTCEKGKGKIKKSGLRQIIWPELEWSLVISRCDPTELDCPCKI